MPSSRNSVFSASLSCATASARGFGNTGTRSLSHCADSAGTFSKSKVATSTLRGEFGQRRLVAVVADQQRRELPGAGIWLGVHHQEAQAERRAGQREHARQLPAAEDPDGGHASGDRDGFAT